MSSDAPSRLLTRRRFLAIAFTLALAATLFLAVRFVVRLVYFSQHREEPVAGWMPLGYVARSYGVPVEALRAELGLAADVRDPRPIEKIAADGGITTEEFIARVEAALTRLRAPSGDASS